MYLSDEVTEYTYLDAASAGLSDVSAGEARFAFADGTLRAGGLAPGSAVSVYGVDGILVSSGTADSFGCVALALPARSGGVYVVKTPVVHFKITKP